ncbi:CAP domain-containing protein [Jatrophihabitans sp.]|uniref:CAP domain-containing protein n=1 Tax=Jatrophihabitans sp. TaxID=1932789 RepID=UPI002C4C5FB5|nr:CAP domain-containing protein [Jatrophihabitans sp.]
MAAATISTVAVATMVMSGSTRRPLTFAGAILLPDHPSASSSVLATATSRPSTSPSRTQTAPSAGTNGYVPPVTELLPAASTRAGIGMPGAGTPGPTAAGAPAPATSSRPAPRTSEPATPHSASNSTAIAHALFSALNKARRDAGLPALSWNPRLQRSAAGHNAAMAQANQLSPRVGGEPALGVRQANQGVLGSYAAEVVGNTGTLSSSGALAVQQAMLAEQPPDDSHRQALLSGAVDAVGIDVLLDPAHHLLWITEDFAQLS